MPGSAGDRGAVGDGAGLRRAASAVRPDAGSPRPDPGAAARGAEDRARPGRGPAAGPVPDRAGRAQLALRGGRRPATDLPDRRRAVAGPGHRADARIRGAAAGRRPGGAGVRDPRSRRRTGRATRAGGSRADGRPRPGATGLGPGRAAGRAGPRPDHRGDPGQPAGAAGAAARAEPGRAGRRVRPACCHAADRPDRGQLRPPAGRAARPDPAAAAAGRGRSVRRPGAGMAGSRATGHRCPGGRAGRGGRTGRVRRPRAVPASADPFGRLPVGAAGRAAAVARGAGQGDRPAARSGPAGLASGAGRARSG